VTERNPELAQAIRNALDAAAVLEARAKEVVRLAYEGATAWSGTHKKANTISKYATSAKSALITLKGHET
jgi:hypothetical protein